MTHLLRAGSPGRSVGDRSVYASTSAGAEESTSEQKRQRGKSPAERFLSKQYAFIRRQHRPEATARKELATLPTMSHHRVFPNHMLE